VDAEDDRTQIDPRDNPWAMLAALPLFTGLPKRIIDQAVEELEWLSEPGGHVLFEAGSPADAVFFVVSGCLGVYAPGGELVGRIAMMHIPGNDFVDTIHVPGLLSPLHSSNPI
jgi:signal-transduction protein with cAMP-binding, CBS, and nucleotidyltransferase domain